MKKTLVVFGTRPEAIKMCPLVKELKAHPEDFDVTICVTGQHREMLDQVLNVFEITPDYDLSIMKSQQSLFSITCGVMNGLHDVILKDKPDIVLVHGDTTTSFAAALAAFYLGIAVGHVEAGLRTYNLKSPYPEEFNRQAVDIIADYYFAPTEMAKQNLIREGKSIDKIYVTGNTGIDALKTTIRDDYQDENLRWVKDSKLILLTAHRRENLGNPMRNMFRAIKRILHEHPEVKVIYPVHFNPEVRHLVKEILGEEDRILLIDPLEVVDFHNYMAASCFIVTDSGGIQEEAPTLGKPVLVMRDTTERPEGIASGTLKLVGTTEEGVFQAINQLLNDKDAYLSMSRASNPYGDGCASERICNILRK